MISVKDFGAKGDGGADDTAGLHDACSAAYDAAHVNGSPGWQGPNTHVGHVTGGLLFIPPGQYCLRNWTVTRSLAIMGAGRASRLMPHSSCLPGDYIMKVTRSPVVNYQNSENLHPGLSIDNLMFDGRARSIDVGALELGFWITLRSTAFGLRRSGATRSISPKEWRKSCLADCIPVIAVMRPDHK